MIKLNLLLALLVITSYAQNALKQQFDLADRLYKEQNYYECITELKRLQFFDSGNQYSYITDYTIAKCYKAGAKYDDAVKYFRLALRQAKDSSDIYDLRTEIVRCNILRRTTGQALFELDQIEKSYRYRIKEINYWRGWAYIFEDKWKEAADYFGQIETNQPLKNFCDSVENEKYSILFPKLISYILPGIGQFYTGNYLSGLMSLGWNALFIYLSVNSFYADRIFDGLVTTALFFRFHRGNVQNAEKFAVGKNTVITNEALLYLQNYYQGLKP